MMRRAIVTYETGPVQAEDDMGLLQADVDYRLVDGALHESRIDGDDGLLARERERARHADGMLFGDADVEEAIGI